MGFRDVVTDASMTKDLSLTGMYHICKILNTLTSHICQVNITESSQVKFIDACVL